MIKFFRKIRYDLMEKNKTGKYLKYAIGEIVLVMIGILLALQVNNWNEKRKINSIEESLLSDLKVEIEATILELQSVIDDHTQSLNATIKLSTYMGDIKKIDKENRSTISALFDAHQRNMTYDPRLGTLKSIINSGKTDYISNKKLRYRISSLADIITDANESTNQIQNERSLTLYPVLSGLYERQPDGTMIANSQKLFNSSQFMFWLDYLKVVRKQGLEEENDLLIYLQEMIKLIDLEIKK